MHLGGNRRWVHLAGLTIGLIMVTYIQNIPYVLKLIKDFQSKKTEKQATNQQIKSDLYLNKIRD